MDERLKKKLQEIFGIISILLGIFLALVLISHSSWDPSPFTYTTRKVRNWGGIIGSYASDTLLNMIGIASFILPLAFIFFGINRVMGKQGYKVKIAGTVLLILSLSVFTSLIGRTFHLDFKSTVSGIIGVAIASGLRRGLSLPGAYIVTLSFFFSSIILLIPVTIESMVKKMREEDAKPARKARMEEEPEDPVIREAFIITEPEPVKKAAPAVLAETQKHAPGSYKFPPLDLLNPSEMIHKPERDQLVKTSELLKKSLEDFNITGEIPQAKSGPLVTMFEFAPDAGIKISKVVSLSDDLGRAIGGKAIRISRLPGKSTIGIEVPNNIRGTVALREILSSQKFVKYPSKLTLAVGVDIYGEPFVADLMKMPHLLVAGTTGAGKSVSLSSMIMSIIYRATPDEVKMLMIDPKMIELSAYENIPHLIHPVITNPKEATDSLKKIVFEMERRYRLIAEHGAKNIESFNKKVIDLGQNDLKLPYIIVIIDELADLMYTASSEAESAIVRLAQMARASGIHMIIATQRPSVDVITGIIKANFPTRIAFRVTSKIDSRTILDTNGAEQLLDKGDMIMLSSGARQDRLHGAYITEEEIKRVTEFIRSQQNPDYSLFDSLDAELAVMQQEENFEGRDDLYQNIIGYAESMGEISISSIQRKFKIGYNRAARIMDMMEEDGLVGPPKGAGKPRDFIGKRNY